MTADEAAKLGVQIDEISKEAIADEKVPETQSEGVRLMRHLEGIQVPVGSKATLAASISGTPKNVSKLKC